MQDAEWQTPELRLQNSRVGHQKPEWDAGGDLPVLDATLRGIHGFAGGKDFLGIGLAEIGAGIVSRFRGERAQTLDSPTNFGPNTFVHNFAAAQG